MVSEVQDSQGYVESPRFKKKKMFFFLKVWNGSTHLESQHLGDREAGDSAFEVSLVSRESSRTPKATLSQGGDGVGEDPASLRS